MNYTQNHKIAQVTESTLVVGVDIGSEQHYARAFDWRGLELTRKVFPFSITVWRATNALKSGWQSYRSPRGRMWYWSAVSQQDTTGLHLEIMSRPRG